MQDRLTIILEEFTPVTEENEQQTIRLDQFLKLSGAAATGGHAKMMIQGGEVLVNDQIETRRRRKLVVGDVVNVAGEEYCLEEE